MFKSFTNSIAMPGISEITEAVVSKDETRRWLAVMGDAGVRGIEVYTTEDQPYATMSDLLSLDKALGERRELEFTTLGTCSDMHHHYEAAFAFVNGGRAAGVRYTLADYGLLVKWDREHPISKELMRRLGTDLGRTRNG